MRLKRGVLLSKLGETYVAYDNEKSMMHELNEVGYAVLEFLKSDRTIEEVGDYLKDHYEIEEEQAYVDAGEFLVELRKKDLIVK